MQLTQLMQSYREESIFEAYLCDHALDPYKNFAEVSSALPPRRDVHERAATLQEAFAALDQLTAQLSPGGQSHKWVEQLKRYTERLQTSPSPETAEHEVSQLYPLRKWLFWAPVALLASQSGHHLVPVVVAHFYAVSLAIEPMFTTIGADYCANMALSPLEHIIQTIDQAGSVSGHDGADLQKASLMAFPKEALLRYRARANWSARQPELQSYHGQQQPFLLDSLNVNFNFDAVEQESYHGLSPPFALTPSRESSSSGPVASASSDSQASYLELPHMALPAIGTSEHSTPYPDSTLYGPTFGAPILPSLETRDPFGPVVPFPEDESVYTFGGLSTAAGGSSNWQHQHSGFVNPHQTIWAS